MKKIIPILIVILVVLLAFVIPKSNFLAVKTVEYKLDSVTCADQESIKNLLNLPGKKLPLVNQDVVQAKVIKSYPCIASVTVKKDWPSKLEIEIKGRSAYAVLDFVPLPQKELPDLSDEQLEATSSSESALMLKSDIPDVDEASSSARLLIDKEGIIFAQTETAQSLPEVLYTGEKYNLGERVDISTLNKSIQILAKLGELAVRRLGLPLLAGDTLRVDSQNYGRLQFSLSKDINLELASLQLILRTVTMNSGSSPGGGRPREIKSIDLRFNKPVVVYGKHG